MTDEQKQPSQPVEAGEPITKEWCMKMAALEPDEGVPPAGMAAVVLDDERAAFEKWARKQPAYIIKDLQRYADDYPDKSRAGQYGHCTTASAWMIWQASAASTQAKGDKDD